jgi:hypothetical protein
MAPNHGVVNLGGLPIRAVVWDFMGVNHQITIRRLFAILVIVGIVIAPLVTPAAAKHIPIANTTEMTAMSGAMPCCPDGPMTGGCPDCPLVAMCMLTVALAEPPLTIGIQVSFEPRRLFFALENITADGLVGVPPDHPPRILT